MSFENYKYSVDKDPYEGCLEKSKRLNAINPHIKFQMRNHKLLTPIPGKLEYALKFRCNQIFTLDEISNTLQEVRKRKNIGKNSPYKSNSFREKQPFRVENKDRPREKVAEVTKKKNSCHNFGPTDHYAKNCPKVEKRSVSLKKYQCQ
ncbi:hypothetical protein O181_130879, partial [Austropuccinia psidii MF-1]|nr:hypothetical protein [Austropuccinia psidii MF-1]